MKNAASSPAPTLSDHATQNLRTTSIGLSIWLLLRSILLALRRVPSTPAPPLTPITGREAIANTIASFIRPGAPGIESIEFRVVNIAANGPVVMTERVDVFKLPNKSFELPVMGTFEVSDGKINAWRDYFDMNQFTSRMG